ncbi:MAG: response regulator, partial [Immundisolibacteraceae bacterium]|nr:response regulator [Immundisolibacteraceae bacterium]
AVLVYLRDLTERNQRERMQREMASRVQQSQKLESLGVLAGGIAHDFNNLLTSMLGNANLAATALGRGHAAIRNLENIEAAAVRAGELCGQMLTYAGQGRFALEPTDLNHLVDEMTRLLELTVSKKAVVKYHLETNLPPAIADPAQVRQALMNMVLNASEAIGDTSGLITINTGMMRAQTSYLQETYLSPDLPEGDYLYLEVNDNGGGMTPEIKARIFDPFFSTKFTGRGLGLAAVLGIVRSHDGALKVYSEPGRGTTFKLLLPLASDVETEPAGAEISELSALTGLVLIADDEESVAAVTAQMVEAIGLQAVIATNGRECLDLFVSNPRSFDLVLLDLMMPEMNGEETFRELRAVDPAAKVILTSGFNEQDAAHRFSGKGLAGFLQKPYHLSELKQILELVLSKS